MKGKKQMITKIIINKLDVKYREIENFENQYDVFKFICGHLDDKQLTACLRFAQSKKKQEKLELKGGE